jgi:hypothetical protein
MLRVNFDETIQKSIDPVSRDLCQFVAVAIKRVVVDELPQFFSCDSSLTQCQCLDDAQ